MKTERPRRKSDREKEYDRDYSRAKHAARRDDPEYRRKNAERARQYRKDHPERIKKRDKEYYEKNRERLLAYQANPERRRKKAARMKAWRAANPELSRLQFRAWNHGLTVERLREMLAGGCAVCGSTDRLHIDHDHSCCPPPKRGAGGGTRRACGRCVRGVLCHQCNTALGLLKEDPARIEALLTHVLVRIAPQNGAPT